MRAANPAETNSVKQNAYHTPFAPTNRLNKYAAGIMTITYRNSEINKEGAPLPNPSSAPEQVTDTADMTNPRLMICSAVIPISIVSRLLVNNPISFSEMVHDRTVPSNIIIMTILKKKDMILVK